MHNNQATELAMFAKKCEARSKYHIMYDAPNIIVHVEAKQ